MLLSNRLNSFFSQVTIKSYCPLRAVKLTKFLKLRLCLRFKNLLGTQWTVTMILYFQSIKISLLFLRYAAAFPCLLYRLIMHPFGQPFFFQNTNSRFPLFG